MSTFVDDLAEGASYAITWVHSQARTAFLLALGVAAAGAWAVGTFELGVMAAHAAGFAQAIPVTSGLAALGLITNFALLLLKIRKVGADIRQARELRERNVVPLNRARAVGGGTTSTG